jgi:hypothetical protein
MLSIEWTGIRNGNVILSNQDNVVPFLFEETKGFLSCLFHGGKRVSQRSYKRFESYSSEELEEFVRSGFVASMSYHYG